MLNQWLNSKTIESLEKHNKDFTTNKPFPHTSIDNFLNDQKAEDLLKALENEEYYEEDHDLYQFMRTTDFKHSKTPEIIELRKFLKSKEFIEFIEKLTSTKLNKNQIDLHSLKLLNTHYLLCHDDDIQGRKLAFIINLSKNIQEKDGGQFEIFESKNGEPTNITKSIIPKFNRFNIFEVTPNKSFHQITENTSNKERISIGGWYYKK